MKRNIVLSALNFLLALVLLAGPVLVQAQVSGDVTTGLKSIGSQINATGSTGFFNANDSAVVIIGKVIRVMLFISGSVTVLFVVIGGFMYLTSAGNEEQAGKGQKTITYALIGLVIMILAYIIVSVLVDLLSRGNYY